MQLTIVPRGRTSQFSPHRLPVSHVMLSMDPAQMPFLNELVTFAAKDWSYPPAAQSYSAFEKAAAAVASCLSMATQPSLTTVQSNIESMMHTAETTLMQALAPALVKIGPAVNGYLSQLHRVTTLCLPNSIPNDPDSTIRNLKGAASPSLLMRCFALPSHSCFCSNRSPYQPHQPEYRPQPPLLTWRNRCIRTRDLPLCPLPHAETIYMRLFAHCCLFRKAAL